MFLEIICTWAQLYMYIMKYSIYKATQLPLCNIVSIQPMFIGSLSLSFSFFESYQKSLGKN